MEYIGNSIFIHSISSFFNSKLSKKLCSKKQQNSMSAILLCCFFHKTISP